MLKSLCMVLVSCRLSHAAEYFPVSSFMMSMTEYLIGRAPEGMYYLLDLDVPQEAIADAESQLVDLLTASLQNATGVEFSTPRAQIRFQPASGKVEVNCVSEDEVIVAAVSLLLSEELTNIARQYIHPQYGGFYLETDEELDPLQFTCRQICGVMTFRRNRLLATAALVVESEDKENYFDETIQGIGDISI